MRTLLALEVLLARSRARLHVVLACCLLVATTATALQPVQVAHAQPDESNPPGYDAAIDQALAAFDRGQFATAREQFLRAHKIFPNARTLRALGKAEFELKRYAEAASHLSLSLESQVRPLTKQQRLEAEILLKKSEDFLATYTLEVEPAQAELRLDGNSIGLESGNKLRLESGEHTLEASAVNYMPWRRELSVRAHEDALLQVTLSPVANEQPAPEVVIQEDPAPIEPVAPVMPQSDEDPRGRRKRRIIIWTTVGAVVLAGAITGLVVGLRGGPDHAQASGGSTGLVVELDPRGSN